MLRQPAPGQRSVAEALKDGVHAFLRASASPRTDAMLLLAHSIGRSREWAVAHPEARLVDEQIAGFIERCKRRRAGEPIAYIIGAAGFYGREFLVNEHVLVPRPETEHLIEEAVAFVRGPMRILDVGTGCGAIACTIAAETQAVVDATDSSPTAIALARENARRLCVADRCAFYEGDLAQPVSGRYDVVIANLPYVPTRDLPKSPDPASFEPRLAFDGGSDGLSLYRKLMPALPNLIDERGMILLEAAPPTIEQLASMLHATLPNFATSVIADYAGLPRYVRAVGTRGGAYVPVTGRVNPRVATEGESAERRAT